MEELIEVVSSTKPRKKTIKKKLTNFVIESSSDKKSSSSKNKSSKKNVKPKKKTKSVKKKPVFDIDKSSSGKISKKNSSKKSDKSEEITLILPDNSLEVNVIKPISDDDTMIVDTIIDDAIKEDTIIDDAMLEEKINKTEKRLNEDFIQLLGDLSDVSMKQGEVFKGRAYAKAQETLLTIPESIVSTEQIKGKPGIGATIHKKLQEYVDTGKISKLEKEKNNPINILTEIHGIGPKKAKELISEGMDTIDKLRENQSLLNEVQQQGLKYYQDTQKKIPRDEILEYQTLFEDVFKEIEVTGSKFEIVGSFRRGALFSGDIDIIITGPNNQVYKKMVQKLIDDGIIVVVLSRGETKTLVIAKIPSSSVYRRVDFMYTPEAEYPFAVLYFTGSKFFNMVMRQQALKLGYTMNEHGLYEMIGKKKGAKIKHPFKTEKDIFDYLNMQYKNPEDRKDGRAVTLKTITENIPGEVSLVEGKSELDGKSKIEKEVETFIQKSEQKLPEPVEIVDEIVKPVKKIKKSVKRTPNEIKNYIKDFKKKGIEFLDLLSESQLGEIIKDANDAYYNKKILMTDNEYDIVKEYIENKYPNNAVLKLIGAPVEKQKVTLPYFMPSMDKIKPDTNALEKWESKYPGPYVLSCKLDGVSALYSTEGDKPKLYTRGDGKMGQDISHLLRILNIPKTDKKMSVRGEILILKKDFDDVFKGEFANARNLVAGLVNQKKPEAEKMKYLHFVAYELIHPEMKPSEQMKFVKDADFEVVKYIEEPSVNNELLSKLLVDWRTNYIYEMDGIIVTDDKIHPRKDGNPEHSFAFKMVLSDQVAEAKVVDVIWSPSKDGYLKPRVRIEPINLGGVKIEYATGFNGAFIEQNKIGVGAIIQLIRSGDVIPYIKKVVDPAEEPKMPSIPYVWNNTHVDIMLEDKSGNDVVKEKNLTAFFKGIGVEGLSAGTIRKLMKAGYTTIDQILLLTKEDLMKIEGFKKTLSNKIYDNIQKAIQDSNVSQLMAASNIFGRGFSNKKIELIMDEYPDLLETNESNEEKIKKLSKVKGMSKKTAEQFVNDIPTFIEFMNKIGKTNLKMEVVEVDPSTQDLKGQVFVFTGFRDKELEKKIIARGAKVSANVSKSTTKVLTKEIDEDAEKIKKAKELGVPIVLVSDFEK